MAADQSDEWGAGGESSGVSVLDPHESDGRAVEAVGPSTRGILRRLPMLVIRRGPWRVAVAEESMVPALATGDWLLLDPTPTRWPRRGSVVVVREPDSGILAIKRIAAGPGDRVRTGSGTLLLAGDEAWLLGDNRDRSVDSRSYGPVPLETLVGRAWFRYAPAGRIGLIARPARPRR
jgi:signal peptidase I